MENRQIACTLFGLLFVLAAVVSGAAQVTSNMPADVATIQAGITAANKGDARVSCYGYPAFVSKLRPSDYLGNWSLRRMASLSDSGWIARICCSASPAELSPNFSGLSGLRRPQGAPHVVLRPSYLDSVICNLNLAA